jgi:Tfp pilus assembly protein PilN
MMRINLLPPEILERRRAERRIGYVVLAAIAVAVVLAGVWAFSYFRLEAKRQELASIQQQVQAAQAQAQQLAVFEERASQLEARRAIAAQAFAGKRDWAKLLDELSLVLPDDVWLQTLTAGETEGLSITGYAVDTPNDTPDVGHKSIAKTLVRLADLDQLSDVWLTTSSKVLFLEQDAIQFSITAKVDAPPAEGGTQ